MTLNGYISSNFRRIPGILQISEAKTAKRMKIATRDSVVTYTECTHHFQHCVPCVDLQYIRGSLSNIKVLTKVSHCPDPSDAILTTMSYNHFLR